MSPHSKSALEAPRVLHAVWSPERQELCLWAEHPAIDVKARRGSGVRIHPFTVNVETLGDIPGEPGEFTFSLPSHEYAPLPSPEVQALAGALPSATETVVYSRVSATAEALLTGTDEPTG